MEKQTERRKGAKYIVSPYKLIINDGNYYLLAFDDNSQQIRTYRVDRMKAINRLGTPRDGAEAFAAIDMKTYTQRTFSMFGGERERVSIRFVSSLLDTAVERFGRYNVSYSRADDHHLTFRQTWRSATSSSAGSAALAQKRSCSLPIPWWSSTRNTCRKSYPNTKKERTAADCPFFLQK